MRAAYRCALTKLILDHSHAQVLLVVQDVVDQRGLASAQEAGDDCKCKGTEGGTCTAVWRAYARSLGADRRVLLGCALGIKHPCSSGLARWSAQVTSAARCRPAVALVRPRAFVP